MCLENTVLQYGENVLGENLSQNLSLSIIILTTKTLIYIAFYHTICVRKQYIFTCIKRYKISKIKALAPGRSQGYLIWD